MVASLFFSKSDSSFRCCIIVFIDELIVEEGKKVGLTVSLSRLSR